jgi:hypothetical protein
MAGPLDFQNTAAQVAAAKKAAAAKTAADAAAAAKAAAAQKAADQKALAQAQAMLAATKTKLAAAQTQQATLATTKTQAAQDLATAKANQALAAQGVLDAKAGAQDLAKSTPGVTYDPVTGQVSYTAPATSKTTSSVNKTVVGTYEDPVTGDIYQVWSDGTRTLLSAGTKAADDAAAAAKGRYDAEQAALAKQAEEQAAKRDAFALIQDTMRAYGFTDAELSELSGFIEKSIIDPNVGPNQAILNMRNLAVYQSRFAGNKTRLSKGLNALSEADYLQQEKDYGQYFQQYGVASLATRAQMATMIGNDIAPTEAKTRIGLAIDRVKNSDPQVLAQLKTYYPTITDADLVTYFLKPEQVLPELQKKVTASEIGAAAVGQNLAATNALDLANYGIDRSQALAGYADIKGVLPVSGKLGDIYGEAGIKYDQTAAESEFFKQNQDAAEKRRRLKSMERASFTGATSANLSRTQQGQF